MLRTNAFILGFAVLSGGCTASPTTPTSTLPSGADNARRIVGIWEPTNIADDLPPESTIEFTTDLQVVLHEKQGGKTLSKSMGTYLIEGGTITLTAKTNGQEDITTNSIKVLTDENLTLVELSGTEQQFKRKR